MKKNILKVINPIVYILAIILLILVSTVGKNVSLQPVLDIFVKGYFFLVITTVVINTLNYFYKK
ncbi:hypothetical protein [Metaclostridioides mangenotii]|uniref:Membrane protein n=1 Tax=Metaclostridioides mangenotii TaxID=1540 RepID=A0ABS4EEL4_9FIRM|nr:hypothetical protein [Clostridioides mangenotii]MBP1856387.1 putative membrane protein [Clostridioides mangenotii]